MKVAVTSTGPTLDDHVEARFGRCGYFLIVDTDSMQYEALENPNFALGGGAGIQSAQMMAEKGVSHVLTGNCGPNAFRVFGAVGVAVVVGVTGRVREAAERFTAGEFASAGAANVQSHFGMGLVQSPEQTPGLGFGGSAVSGPRMGMGRGGGRGMGGGLRMGGGRGMGGGRRMGGGRGMGGGKGMGLGGSGMPAGGAGGFGASQPPTPALPQSQDELQRLKEQAEALKQQKQEVENRIEDLQSGRRVVAVVQAEKCTGCGVCARACPNDAIHLDKRAFVDPDRCTACGVCVSACPAGAIIITPQGRQ